MRKQILISADRSQCKVAILEEQKLAEVYIEKKRKRSIVGNIYLGKVTNVLPGMSAAFLDVGTGKNALLYAGDMVVMEDGSEVDSHKVLGKLKKGSEIPVQVTKDPMQGKGARLTTQLSIPGRTMVFVPNGNKVGVSRRLDQKERERLRNVAKDIKQEEGSLIVRTAAQGAEKKVLAADARYLRRLWKRTAKRLSKAAAPKEIYIEPGLAVKVVRDNFSEEFNRLIVDSRTEYRRIMEYLSMAVPELKGRVELYDGDQPLMKKYGIDAQIWEALKRKVKLTSGGTIVIDEAEALTAIDVNTGSYTGKSSLEDTILKTNLEAAEEIVRQLRLRDIGGIIVIDFIDMESRKHREKVMGRLEKELQKDKTKTQIVTLSRLGLVEMTRKNVTEGLVDTLGTTCSRCGGRGLVFKSDKS